MAGLPIDIQHLDRDIYYLLVLFSASRTLAANEKLGESTLRDQFEQSEATKQLISVAVCLRNSLDAGCPGPPEIREKFLQEVVGKLKQNGKPKKDLGFRDACNKIIHAIDLEFKTKTIQGKTHITPTVVLWGKHRDTEWEATLDILAFANLAYTLNLKLEHLNSLRPLTPFGSHDSVHSATWGHHTQFKTETSKVPPEFSPDFRLARETNPQSAFNSCVFFLTPPPGHDMIVIELIERRLNGHGSQESIISHPLQRVSGAKGPIQRPFLWKTKPIFACFGPGTEVGKKNEANLAGGFKRPRLRESRKLRRAISRLEL